MEQFPHNELFEPDQITDEVEPRDPAWLRWAKFVSIVVVLAMMLGGLFGISVHVVALHTLFSSNHTFPTDREKRLMEPSDNDTKHAFKQRFVIGSTIGGVCGLIYVIRCLVKDEDP